MILFDGFGQTERQLARLFARDRSLKTDTFFTSRFAGRMER